MVRTMVGKVEISLSWEICLTQLCIIFELKKFSEDKRNTIVALNELLNEFFTKKM